MLTRIDVQVFLQTFHFQNDPHHFILFFPMHDILWIPIENNKNQFYSIVALYFKLMPLEQDVAKMNTPQLHSNVAYLGTPHSLGFVLHIST
jgi:hypothetical protein